jgi:hypothetical protein
MLLYSISAGMGRIPGRVILLKKMYKYFSTGKNFTQEKGANNIHLSQQFHQSLPPSVAHQ